MLVELDFYSILFTIGTYYPFSLRTFSRCTLILVDKAFGVCNSSSLAPSESVAQILEGLPGLYLV